MQGRSDVNMTTTLYRPAGSKVLRVLLLDDDKMMLTVIGDTLEDLGASQVIKAENGTVGIQAFDRMAAAPEMVMCDLSMPGSDGFQFMEQLGARKYGGAVVLMSGMSSRYLNSASLMGRFHQLNIVAVMNKPIDETALRQAMAKLR
jgi:CheY-like chemotaxis protein